MATRIQVRRGTQSEWLSANPILMVGELGAETDTGRWKIGDGVTAWNGLRYGFDAKISTILVTTSKTLELTDNFTMLKCYSATDITITIPEDVNVNFPIDSEIVIVRYGTGLVSIIGENAVIVNSEEEKKKINKQYDAITIKKIASNEWLVIGSLAL